MATQITQQDVEALLGRSLTTVESANFNMYLSLAETRVGDLICNDITKMETIPDDLKLVVARFFDALSKEQGLQGDVQSKRVEDFSVSYREDYRPVDEVIKLCRDILAKYSNCSDGIMHGRTIYGDCIRRF